MKSRSIGFLALAALSLCTQGIVAAPIHPLSPFHTQARQTNTKPNRPSLPEPGPANGGLKMRLVVFPDAEAVKEGYEVRVDLLNVTKHKILLRSDWPYEEMTGDVKDYIEASTSIESYPAIRPWAGGVRASLRKSPQAEYVLKAGEVLSVRWHTQGRYLKNKVTNPNAIQNPEFAIPGLYSVHATVAINTPDRTVLLRSNEALVSIGHSDELPRHTFGELWEVNRDTKMATLSLGSLHKIERGDQFLIGGNKEDQWRLIITEVRPEYSLGRLEPEPFPAGATKREPDFPKRYSPATLVPHP